ncbi:hypothetical protein ABT173_05870 [Streptomyces sp. NPDC001795]|uniref:hypothetical protein n=1 Tax=unclassified Streptomyces TaxID=2593676 RepID=UPI00331A4FC9
MRAAVSGALALTALAVPAAQAGGPAGGKAALTATAGTPYTLNVSFSRPKGP